MKITIQSTEQLVDISTGHVDAPLHSFRARVWRGKTESGIAVQVLVSRVAVEATEQQDEFERELTAQHAPAPEPRAFPLRVVL